jgi:hypothetical protein
MFPLTVAEVSVTCAYPELASPETFFHARQVIVRSGLLNVSLDLDDS